MPTIAADDTFVQIVQFDIESDEQEPLIAAIVGEVERWVRHRPGFVSSTFHASLDGRHVMNYAQWRTRADFEAFTADPETERLGRAIHAAGSTGGHHTIQYRVARIVDAAPGENDT